MQGTAKSELQSGATIDGSGDASKQDVSLNLLELIDHNNIAELLDKDQLAKIGQNVVEEFEADLASRADWEDCVKEVKRLVRLQAQPSNFPFKDASSPMVPLITEGALQFSARTPPNIIKDNRICKARVVGSDTQGTKLKRAERVSEYTSFEIMEDMPEWECEFDQALFDEALVGCYFKKTYHDGDEGCNCSDYVPAENLVVDYYAKSFEKAARATHFFYLYPNEIKEKILGGEYLDYGEKDIFKLLGTGEVPDADRQIDHSTGNEKQGGDTDENDKYKPHQTLEQHRWLDLDGDGYEEPYIVTVHHGTKKTFRIVARYDKDTIIVKGEGGKKMTLTEAGDDYADKIVKIKAEQYFTRTLLLPSPDGGFYGLGLGTLLQSTNDYINGLLKAILDAATLQNASPIVTDGTLKPEDGNWDFVPGKTKVVKSLGGFTGDFDIRRHIYRLDLAEPSLVLFQLFGALMEYSKRLAANPDVLAGESPGANSTATATLALIEQGLQLYTSIYKRIYRGLRDEFRKLFRLNSKYLTVEKYNNVIDRVEQDENGNVIQLIFDPKKDFSGVDKDVVPVADPNNITTMQKLAKAQMNLQVKDDPVVNRREVMRRYFEATGQEDVEALLIPEEAMNQPPPDLMIKQMELEIKNREVQLKELELQSEMQFKAVEAQKMEAETQKLLAEAKAVGDQPRVAMLEQQSKEQQEVIRSLTNNFRALQGREKKAA